MNFLCYIYKYYMYQHIYCPIKNIDYPGIVSHFTNEYWSFI